MAQDPTITEKVKVHLKTRLSVEGAVKWAHPITELRCVVSASSGGGIRLSGNSIYFDRTVLQLPTSSEVPIIASDYFCPLQLVVNGSTQYADMFVRGATATVAQVPDATGYGEFSHPIDVVQAVRDTATASSMCVPSELAVANALEHKQRLLSAGSFVSFTSGNVADIIAVDGAIVIRPVEQATYDVLATEGATRDAIDAASASCKGYTDQTALTLSGAITGSGYATSAWVNANFVRSGTIPPAGPTYTFTSGITEVTGHTVKLVPAGSNFIGGVQIPTGSGLTLNAETGALTVASASAYATYAAASAGTFWGGVRVAKIVQAAPSDSAKGMPIVPTVQAVYEALDTVQTKYLGQFVVTKRAGSSDTYDITGGTVYLDGLSTSYGYATSSAAALPSGSTNGELWAIVYSGDGGGGNVVSYEWDPTFSPTQTSIPVAYVDGTTVCQHQLGPIVLRGRWV